MTGAVKRDLLPFCTGSTRLSPRAEPSAALLSVILPGIGLLDRYPQQSLHAAKVSPGPTAVVPIRPILRANSRQDVGQRASSKDLRLH